MKPVVKGLLIGCGAIALLGIATAIFVGRYIAANKDKWRAKGGAVITEGSELGKSVKEPQCVDKALDRYRNDSSLTSFVQTRLWLTGCLKTSAVDPQFCSGVPGETEILKTVTWSIGQCNRRGFEGDSDCAKIIREVQRYCHGEERRRKLAAP